MKFPMMLLIAAALFAFPACEACYECEGYLGDTDQCCGDKDECDNFKKDCDLNGGRIISD